MKLSVSTMLLCLVQYEDLGQLCSDPRARAAVLAEMDAIGKEAQVIILSMQSDICSSVQVFFNIFRGGLLIFVHS